MNWLREYLTREGPGIRKDAPKKQGLALLGDIVRREWWELLQFNLLYVLFALPVVALGAWLGGDLGLKVALGVVIGIPILLHAWASL